MSKQQANISLSKAFKDHKSKEKIFYLAKRDKDLIDLFINFSNFDGSKISTDIRKAIDASDFCKLVDLWPYVQLHILVSSLKRIQSA